MPDKITFDGVWNEVLEMVHRTNQSIGAVEGDAVVSQEADSNEVSRLKDDLNNDVDVLINERIFPEWRTMFGYPPDVAIQTTRSVTKYDKIRKGYSTRFGPMVVVDRRDVFLLTASRNIFIDLVDLLLEQMPLFRESFPEYHDYRLMGVVTGLTMEDGADRYAMDKGLFVIVQSRNTSRVANRVGFMPRVW